MKKVILLLLLSAALYSCAADPQTQRKKVKEAFPGHIIYGTTNTVDNFVVKDSAGNIFLVQFADSKVVTTKFFRIDTLSNGPKIINQ